ncbi:phospholipid N-methyltransferase [Streptomyces sp. V4I23]|uniref:class I SAM-dependent methyltransferase n=1 Tax=Streptomyces sp. V4I23 TaxID=3042282 RepID=UPI0027829EAC|nr:class I SAM-dependent methyltransferase [Streptomyces sp. V4I23]MDQ1006967.1 phospholipid N-methyltransferase [Streptomyces sp. V4I23]
MNAAETETPMACIQEQEHGVGYDYAKGSPHILHHGIRERVVAGINRSVGSVLDRKGSCRVLELGAGHGAFTDHLVATGAEVEVTEMSAPSAAVLKHRFRHNRQVTVTYDPDGESLSGGSPLDVVVLISVLHHIPDYLRAVEQLVERITPGGAFMSFQDPLWYPRRSRSSMSLDRSAYLIWRLGQGEARRGIATRLRRIRGVYDESNPADMAEYHVVRHGIDEKALQNLLEPAFGEVKLDCYWSTQSRVLQALGERLAPPTTFGIVALNRH